MNKLSFRARTLDATKPLPIYHADELPDLDEYSTIIRGVPQMPTGMEKEEESERHLQAVIMAQQNTTKKSIYIPTPESTIPAPHYDKVYSKVPARSNSYVRTPGLGLEEDLPDYDMDSEDEEWLKAQSQERPLTPLHFERMMDKLEKNSGNTVLSDRDAQLLLKDGKDLVIAVYDYWLNKRLRVGHGVLIPTVKQEKRDGTSKDPYLAFRKRTEKMQTRKNRKNDETAYMQMLKLKRDLTKACSLTDMVKERERKKQELAQICMEVFKKRYILEDWSGSIMSSLRPVSTKSSSSKVNMVSDTHWDGESVLTSKQNGDDDDGEIHHIGRHEVLIQPPKAAKKRKKKFDKYLTITPETETPLPVSPDKRGGREFTDGLEMKSDDDEVDGPFTFRRRPHIRYHMPRSNIHDWPWSGDDDEAYKEGNQVSARKKYRFSRATLCGQLMGHARRRVGRGGRLVWDCSGLPDDDMMSCDPDGMQNTTVSTVSVPPTPERLLDTTSSSQKDFQQPPVCLHFVPQSPSPMSNFEFQHLPLMEGGALRSAPPAVSSPGCLAFGGGLPSDSEFHGEVLSFSSLPTSRFSLKPSTSDLPGDVQCDYLEQLSRLQQHRKLAGDNKTLGGSPNPSTPSSVDGRSAPNFSAMPQMGPPPSSSTFQTHAKHDHRADPNRASLSVADSKTIILTSAKLQQQPTPPLPPPLPPPQPPKSVADKSFALVTPPLPHPSTAPFTPTTTTTPKDSSSSSLKTHPPQSGSEDSSIRTHPTTTPISSLNGPSHCILKLNSPQWMANSSSRSGGKTSCKITVETALLITSQLMEHTESLKKEEAGPVPKATPPTAAQRDSPTLPQLMSPPLRMEGLLPNTAEKKGVVTLQQGGNKRVASNGSSYPDLFHSATRRLSETERGLKQALAGSVMNHAGSLVDATTASLVQLGNSSEVT